MRTHLVRLNPKKILYRNFKNFNEQSFLIDVENTNFNCDGKDPNRNYDNLVDTFIEIVDKHAPLKTKFLRGNEAPFMNKELRKAIYTRSRLKNKWNKNPTLENRAKYKKQRNKCVSLRKKAIKTHFHNITQNGVVENKDFWNTVKPFITNKSGKLKSDITIIHNEEIIRDEQKLVEIFNNEYINIVENSSGIKPEPLGNFSYGDGYKIISEIENKYKNDASIIEIKNRIITDESQISCNFKEVSELDISKLFGELKTHVATGEDKIPAKLVKLSKQFLLKPLTTAINSSIRNSVFPNKAKCAMVTPIDKGGKDKFSISNYRPVSVLNIFSKFYERVIKSQIVAYIDIKLSKFLSAYRRSYGTQHVLMRLIEEWKQKLDKNFICGAVLMDLSKAFDCVPHDLLLAKLSAYGFDKEALILILSYLTDREQATRINNSHSLMQLILSGVPQGSILAPILFNIFINDFFYFIKKAEVHNYADDNTLSSFSNSISNLISLLEEESNTAIRWLKEIKMIANPEKFHSIILTKDRSSNSGLEVKIANKIIKTETSVKLLGITIDNSLNFNSHISSQHN